MGERIAFAIAAAGAIGSAALVVTVRDAFRAAVALIGALISVAVIFVLLAAPFVAMIQVIVYAGAIVVLFLFVIAYLGERRVLEAPDRLLQWRFLAWIAVLTLAALGLVALLNSRLAGLRDDPRVPSDIGSPRAVGDAFLHHYLIPFEVTSLVLLVAAVGAVLLAKRAVQMESGR